MTDVQKSNGDNYNDAINSDNDSSRIITSKDEQNHFDATTTTATATTTTTTSTPTVTASNNNCYYDVDVLAKSNDIYGFGNFPQGIKFSPDGLCILTNTVSDHQLRLYNIPSTSGSSESSESTKHTTWKAALQSNGGGDTIRSYDWYPFMNSNDPATCAFASVSVNQPIQLFDAYNGQIRASYCPINRLDEMETPNIIQFTPDGQRLFSAGFKTDRSLHIFDISRPGKDSTAVVNLGKTRHSSDGQKGLVSALTFSSNKTHVGNHNIFAIGTYSPGSIYLYDDRCLGSSSSFGPVSTVLNGVCVVGHGRNHSRKKRKFVTMNNNNGNNNNVTLPSSKVDEEKQEDNDDDDDDDMFSAAKIRWYQQRTQTGVTQLLFSPGSNEYMLYSTSRKSSNCVICWDVRMVSGNPDYQINPIRGYKSFYTNNTNTNQHLQFDFDSSGEKLFVCGVDNCIRIYNVHSGKLIQTIQTNDLPNGISCSSSIGGCDDDLLLAVALGTRKFYPSYSNNEDNDDGENDRNDNNNNKSKDYIPGSIELYRIKQMKMK